MQENEFNEEDIIEIVPHDNDDEHVPAATLHELQAAELKGARDRALALASPGDAPSKRRVSQTQASLRVRIREIVCSRVVGIRLQLPTMIPRKKTARSS